MLRIGYRDSGRFKHKQFLFRSGASLLTSLANLPPQPVKAEDMGQYVVKDNREGREYLPGVVLVGSHVQRSTDQLHTLLERRNKDMVPIKVNIDCTSPLTMTSYSDETERESIIREYRESISNLIRDALLNAQKSVVIYTTREEKRDRHFTSQTQRLEFGKHVSNFLMQLVRNLPSIGFLISKGGITSNDVLSAVYLSRNVGMFVGEMSRGSRIVSEPARGHLSRKCGG